MDQKKSARERLSKRNEQYFNKWKDYDLLTCILALIGLAIGIVDHEYLISIDREVRAQTINSNFTRVLISITTFLAMVSITLRHLSKTKWKNSQLPVEI